MIEISGNFYRAGSAHSFPARVALLPGGGIRVSGEGYVSEYRLTDTEVSRRLGNLTRSFSFADGALFETGDNDAIDRYLEQMGQDQVSRRIHRLERGWLWAGAALLVAVAAGWAFIVVGLPIIAGAVAESLPPEIDDQLGRDGLRLMDELFFEPSQLDEPRQAELRERFAQLAALADIGRDLKLEFRLGGDVGANAFALPSATVVMTDELVALAANDDEIAAVLAHEIGHVDGRHSLRLVLQDSIAALVFAVVLGDVTSISGLAGALPAVLVQNKYSRSFESEADAYALDLMQEAGIEPHHFSDILRRMESMHGGGEIPDFLSTHPATEERASRFE